jgi:penicillin-binding protein 1A
MVETGAITQREADAARLRPAIITDRTFTDARNFFLDAAADEAMKLTGSDGVAQDGDLIVHTTLEPKLEETARHALAHTLSLHGRHARASEGAIVLMKTNGAISALIGGRDYDTSVFNRAMQAKRQPGSAFKPFVYLAALESGIGAWDERDDEPVDIDGWTPTNYGGRSYGTVTLADALAHSINTVTAKLAQEVGISRVIGAARRCGITSPLAANASLALGTSVVTPLELTAAYATFAAGGMRVAPYMVTEVEDSAHHVLYVRAAPAPARIISESVNRDLTAMLYGVLVGGTGRSAALSGREAAGKTGTTQDYRDAWFVGFTPDYVAGVWVGNDDYSPMRNITGGTLPASIWKTVMSAAEQGLPVKRLDKSAPPPPEDVADSDDDNGSVPSGDDESEQSGDSGHGSFWDWLFGRDKSASQQQQSSPGDTGQPQADAPADSGANVTGPPRAENDARRSEDVPPRADTEDTPPVADSDDEARPPPPGSPYAPPPASTRHYVPPPPPPPPSDDDDNNGN